jgi:hypothetical protein
VPPGRSRRASYRARDAASVRCTTTPFIRCFRRILTRDFLVKRIDVMRPGITRKVDEFLTAMTKLPRPVDLVKHVALPPGSKRFRTPRHLSWE